MTRAYGLFFFSLCWNYIDGFSYVEPLLHFLNEACLIMVDCVFDVFGLILLVFYCAFCINDNKGDWAEILKILFLG